MSEPDLELALSDAAARIARLRVEKGNVYTERNLLVAALSKFFPSWLETHPLQDEEWAKSWRTIVFIDGPTGQMSWHVHDSEVDLFDHLEHRKGNSWDRHTTEEKYARLAAIPVHEEEGK
jgi:hypothetical protein